MRRFEKLLRWATEDCQYAVLGRWMMMVGLIALPVGSHCHAITFDIDYSSDERPSFDPDGRKLGAISLIVPISIN